MNTENRESKSWSQRMAEVDLTNPAQLKFLVETASSVVNLGLLPSIDGQPEREVSVEERLETARFMMKLTFPVPDPLPAG